MLLLCSDKVSVKKMNKMIYITPQTAAMHSSFHNIQLRSHPCVPTVQHSAPGQASCINTMGLTSPPLYDGIFQCGPISARERPLLPPVYKHLCHVRQAQRQGKQAQAKFLQFSLKTTPTSSIPWLSLKREIFQHPRGQYQNLSLLVSTNYLEKYCLAFG